MKVGMTHNGFTVLAWVKPDSPLIWEQHHDVDIDTKTEELLQDFNCLLGVRWNMDMHLVTIDGSRYAFGINTRITASEKTIANAIGDLNNHVGFLRGTANNTAEDLARFKVCKEKWRVPEEVSSSTYGWETPAHPETSQSLKRKRFS
nr:nonstructural protein 3 [Canary chaphamaparvovirus 2]